MEEKSAIWQLKNHGKMEEEAPYVLIEADISHL